MSSFGGTSTLSGQQDPTLQIAPTEAEGPDFGALKQAFETCIADLQPYIDQCRQNYEVRYALWNGQSSDGKKHSRPGNGVPLEPVPWDGASDLRVFLNDEAINSKVAMLCTAFRRANVVANPVQGNDIKRAKTVANFMRWLVQTQMPDVQREAELLANYLNEKGVAITGQFWESCQEKVLTTVTIDQLQQQLPPGANVQQLIFAQEAEGAILGRFEEMYGCTTSKARKMLRELRQKGTTTVATVGRERSYPVVRAFNLDEDVFIPHFTTDLESAPAIYRVQYFTPEKLRSFVHTDGWDQEWVETAIETCRGRLITLAQNEYNQPVARSFVYQQQRFTDLIGVVYAYRRLSDEDGIPGIYLTIFNPQLPPNAEQPGYAKHGLLGYAHNQYPFTLHRREYLSRKLHDSRGIPEPGKPAQDNIKAHRDSRVDAASIAMVPPMGHPIGRPPGRWGAGAKVPERRPNEYHFLDRPTGDTNTERSEEILTDSFYRYFGFVSAKSDPTFANLKNQQETDKWLYSWGLAFRQIFKLYQQFGDDQVYFRVIGLKQQDAAQFSKGDPTEDFDFFLSYQVESMNPEVMFQKLQQIAQIVQTADRDGIVNYSEWLQVMVEAIDPTIADRILDPQNVGSQRVTKDMQDLLAKVYAGQDHDVQLGTPPQLGQQIIQQYIQGDPVVQSRMNNKQDPFAGRIEKLMKQLQFSQTQQNNAKIGRLGA